MLFDYHNSLALRAGWGATSGGAGAESSGSRDEVLRRCAEIDEPLSANSPWINCALQLVD
jgi:hypothetical protein